MKLHVCAWLFKNQGLPAPQARCCQCCLALVQCWLQHLPTGADQVNGRLPSYNGLPPC